MTHLPHMIVSAIRQGDMPTVTAYVEDLYTLWMEAASAGDSLKTDNASDSASTTAAKHDNPLDAFDKEGRLNLLHATVASGKAEIVRYLLGLPNSLKMMSTSSDDDDDDEVRRKRRHDAFRCNPHARSYHLCSPASFFRDDPPLGSTPIFWAIMRNRPDLVEMLLLLGDNGENRKEVCSGVNVFTRDDKQLLKKAKHDMLAKSEYGLAILGMEVNDGEGQTPLYYASAMRNSEAAAVLLRHGASVSLDATWEVDDDDHGDGDYSGEISEVCNKPPPSQAGDLCHPVDCVLPPSSTTGSAKLLFDDEPSPIVDPAIKVLAPHTDEFTLQLLLDNGMDPQSAGDLMVQGIQWGGLDSTVEAVLLAEGWHPQQ